jgi:peptidyl-prolyl cis-trans isomerase SurA
MVKQFIASTCLLFLIAAPGSAPLRAQTTDPVLFTVKNNPVYLSEFRQLYTKTHQQKADFSEVSLRAYLDLYVKFKLKVQKARDMRLDTLEAFVTEIDGQRRQLAASYLVDKEVTDKLVLEAYERMKQDADISHIFIACDKNAKAADTLIAYNRAMNLFKMLQNGASFEQVARDSSEDKSAKENSGNLGFVTAMLPDGYYNLEKAVYSAKPDELLRPVRTNAGYHIVRVHSFRPARGEMEVSQIMLRKGTSETENAIKRLRADSIYAALQAGAKWDDICARTSEDQMSAGKGGYIGFFGINRYQRAFEDAAFGLKNDGDISAPAETSLGWHLIKRISHRGVDSFENFRRPLTERVKRDSRSEEAKKSMIARIQKEGDFQEYPDVLARWTAQQVDSIFLTFKWNPDPAKPQTTLQRYGDAKTYTVADFEEYCARASRDRMRGIGNPVKEMVDKLYKNWSDEVAIHFEEGRLEDKYPEFRALMREFKEGTLMFEATNLEVRERASSDSAGLLQYFNQNLASKYKWDERARVSIYTLKSEDPQLLLKVREFATKNAPEAVLKQFNKNEAVLIVLDKTYEKGKNKDLNDVWKAGSLTNARADASTKTAYFIKVEEIIPPTAKTLGESRGYAVADYQDYLEKQWLEKLKSEYPVKIEEAVFQTLIKKQ